MTIFVPVFLLVFLVSVILLLRCVYLLIRRRTTEAKKSSVVLALMVGIYGVALVAVGIGSQNEALTLGHVKCFDDWCVRVNDATREGNSLKIRLDTLNRGRRAQAPDEPHAFIVADGRTIPVTIPSLTDRIEGGSINPIDVNLPVPGETRQVGFLVTEGGGPSMLVIDDENSPFHAKSVWNLTQPVGKDAKH
jgi:hypothetical protein